MSFKKLFRISLIISLILGFILSVSVGMWGLYSKYAEYKGVSNQDTVSDSEWEYAHILPIDISENFESSFVYADWSSLNLKEYSFISDLFGDTSYTHVLGKISKVRPDSPIMIVDLVYSFDNSTKEETKLPGVEEFVDFSCNKDLIYYSDGDFFNTISYELFSGYVIPGNYISFYCDSLENCKKMQGGCVLYVL